ncbi:hypothetical protein RF11_15245 [Thelohanellus kitauei]|uniref:SHSP domain-containing protein n=1 Tax=Thelohanellus kitauei TaxID=669202 RepID=A0A0C2IMX6_THEKT|nr:hypothetical protein RF11_15245 [Thelohanellus kitauei]
MLSTFGHLPTIISIERDLDHLMNDVCEPFHRCLASPINLLYRSRTNSLGRKRKPHVMSIAMGGCYKEGDINTVVEGNKLKVSGKSIESLKNGNNQHQFEREYDIPDDADVSTMKSELVNGYFHVIFERKHVEPKKELEYLSTDEEFRVRVNFTGYKPEEMSARLVANNLIVEASKKSSENSEIDGQKSSMSGYVSRTIRLPDGVQLENLRAVSSAEGLDIFAPIDPKLRPIERKLQIETQ